MGAMCLRPVFAARSPQPAQRAARSARFAQGKPPQPSAPLRVAPLFAFLLSFSPSSLIQRMGVGIKKERRSARTRFENEKLVPPPFRRVKNREEGGAASLSHSCSVCFKKTRMTRKPTRRRRGREEERMRKAFGETHTQHNAKIHNTHKSRICVPEHEISGLKVQRLGT